MAFSITDIKSRLVGGGARPTMFYVKVTWNNDTTGGLQDIQYMVQSSSLPASTIGSFDVPYFGRKIRLAGDRTFEPWTVTVINDENFKIRHAMENWHNQMNQLSTGRTQLASTSPAAYKGTATVFQLSKKGEAIRAYEFQGIFPSDISNIDVDWNDTDSIERFQVTFQYDWYTILKGEAAGSPNGLA